MIDNTPPDNSYSRGHNPKSQKNLNREGRQPLHGEPKKDRFVRATTDGWEGFKEVAQGLGISASELVEQIGRGELIVSRKQELYEPIDQ
ncbi:hypothetical protein H6F90_06200 [Trichocoleus sp. FACHB-591]|uniref:hypothetical protein n=1 Tax=Trichocoleus TaxID=450526 RepID=UPI0016857792|nr:hypothetical protein [Trichocoleus sp. FACHB-591]MBD2094742.1 hypothetical protein [Trichocoleus sp. FACHB-591]